MFAAGWAQWGANHVGRQYFGKPPPNALLGHTSLPDAPSSSKFYAGVGGVSIDA